MSFNKIQYNRINRNAGINRKFISAWITNVVEMHGKSIDTLSLNFCNDQYLLEINLDYLKHNTYTDIITFDLSDKTNVKRINGDVYISIDRIKDNAKKYQTPWKDELHRVIIHGVLHLLGYNDKTKSEQEEMRNAEDKALTHLLQIVSRETTVQNSVK